MLSGDNSILQKATDAKENTDNSQIQERINLAYHSSLVDGKGEITEPSLENELKKEFNKTTLNEGWLDKTSVAGKWKITIDGVSLEVPAGVTSEILSIINYGNKTAQTVTQGDDITIETERFKVLKNESGTIMAIPYYNITLTTNNPVQSSSAEYCVFSTEMYWNGEEKDIDMTDSKNNIQKYIAAYQQTLEQLGATNVTTRIGRTDELRAYETFYGPLNPSQNGNYWLGTAEQTTEGINTIDVDWVGPESVIRIGHFNGTGTYCGVRPIIEITL